MRLAIVVSLALLTPFASHAARPAQVWSDAPSYEHTESVVVADFSGAATLELRDIFRGARAAAVRHALAAMRPDDIGKSILKAYAIRYSGATLASAPVQLDIPGEGGIEVRARLLLPSAVYREDTGYVLGFDNHIVPGERMLFDALGGAADARYRLRILWPASVRAETLPFVRIVDNAYFSLRAASALRGNMADYLLDYHPVGGNRPVPDTALRSAYDKLPGAFQASLEAELPGTRPLSMRNFSAERQLHAMRTARATATFDQIAQWEVPELCEHLRSAYRSWAVQTEEERAAIRPLLNKLHDDSRPGVGACEGQLNFMAGDAAESAAWYARETYVPDDRVRLEQSWARWYSGEHDAALQEALAYVVAARESGALNGEDLSLAIALYDRAGRALPDALMQALLLPADAPWPAPLLAWQRGALSETALFTLIHTYPADAREKALSDTWFRIGVHRLASGDAAGAATAFRWYWANGIRGEMPFILAAFEQPRKSSTDADFLAGLALAKLGKWADAAAAWRKAAQRGDIDAATALGSGYISGRGVAKDRAEAHRWLDPAAQAGSGAAMTALAALAFDEPPSGREKALALLEQGVALENPDAMLYLSELYHRGIVTPPDPAREIDLERRAAEMEVLAAQSRYASRYLDGVGVARNDDLVRYWAQRAIRNGNDDGYALLARLLMRGDAADQRTALGMVRNPAESGNEPAMRAMGYAAMRGIGQPVDLATGRTWYVRAQEGAHYPGLFDYSRILKTRQYDAFGAFDTSLLAAQDGNADAQTDVAWKYRHGDGTEIDLAASLRWLREAVRQDDLNAINNLGDAYETGAGVPVDLTRAMELNRQAAQRGGVRAFASLASVYEKGVGTAPDLRVAYTHLLLCQRFLEARRPGAPVEPRTLAMAARLSAQDQAQARADALAWQPGQALPGDMAAQVR